MAFGYQALHSPLLSPPSRRIAVRRGSNRKEDPDRADAQLLEMTMARAPDCTDQRAAKTRPARLESVHRSVDRLAVGISQTRIPGLELKCDLDGPRHRP